MPSSIDWECDSSSSSSSSDSSLDEDHINARVYPYWQKHRALIFSKGYRLETVRDVREHYQLHGVGTWTVVSGYYHAHTMSDDNAICKDPGLPDNLFRATCCVTGMNLVIKAVNRLSREVQNVPPFPLINMSKMQYTAVLAIIDVPADGISFIVMEAWSSHLLLELPPRLRDFLSIIRQCIEHIVFMHRNGMAHLDISLHNFITNDRGDCACIDYELSQRVDSPVSPLVYFRKGAEVPPELERDHVCDPYMVDVWALGMLILRACKIVNLYTPELLHLTRPMLHHDPEMRPSAVAVLQELKRLVLLIGEERLNQPC